MPDASPMPSARVEHSVPHKAARGRASLTLHDFGVAFRMVLPVLEAALAVFAVLMPISTAAIPDISVFNLDYTHDQLKWRFWASDMLYPVYACTILFGLVLGIRSFKFLLVKCETTTFLNLPLSRLALFATRALACLIALVLGIGIPLAISLGVNIVALNVWTGLFGDFFYVLAGLVLTGAVSCAIAVACCTLGGTVVEACTFAVAVLGSVTVGAWGLNALMSHLLVGNAFGAFLYNGTTAVAPTLVESTEPWNPLLFFLGQVSQHSWFMVQHPVYYPASGDWGLLGIWTAVLTVVCAFAAWRLCRRKGERAGVAGLCIPLTFVVGLVVGLAAFGATFTALAQVNIIAACVAAFAAFLLVSAILFRGPLRGASRLRTTFAVMGSETLCLIAVVAVISTGGLGYSSYVPSVDDVASVGVSYAGSPDYLAVKFDAASAGSGSYYYSATYTFDNTDDIESVVDVHEQLAATGHAALARDRKDFGSSVVPYDVKICYTMKDGSQVIRYFDRATYDELYNLAGLDDSDTSRELARACVSSDVSTLSADQAQALNYSSAHQAYTNGSIYLSDPYYASSVKLTCTSEARTQLLAALAEDASDQSVEDRYHPQGAARGILMFTQSGESDAQSFAYSLSNNVIYLTDEYTHTLAWIQANGLSGYVTANPSVIESLTFQRYDPYAGMNAVKSPSSVLFKGYRMANDSHYIVMQDFGTKYSTKDADELSQIVPLLRNTYFMNTGGYLVCAKLGGVNEYSYFFLPDSDVPEWLLRVAG
jgi:ABC-2 type transport system permease protein